MNRNNKIFLGIMIGVLVLSLIGNFNQFQTNIISNDQIDALKFQRDSIIANSIIESKAREQVSKNKADSILLYNKTLIKADSINHYKNNHERAKIKYYTPAIRNHVYDSIYGTDRL